MGGHSKKWLGEVFSEDYEDYNQLPWEKDALKMEIMLYRAWLLHKGNKNGKRIFDRDVA